MTKSELFKRAWTIAKEAAELFGGSSKSYFAESLKQAHKENKMDKIKVYEIINERIIGGYPGQISGNIEIASNAGFLGTGYKIDSYWNLLKNSNNEYILADSRNCQVIKNVNPEFISFKGIETVEKNEIHSTDIYDEKEVSVKRSYAIWSDGSKVAIEK